MTGRGGPNLPGGFIPGVTAGYGPDGTLLWEAFSTLETGWAGALPNDDVCATGGPDALITNDSDYRSAGPGSRCAHELEGHGNQSHVHRVDMDQWNRQPVRDHDRTLSRIGLFGLRSIGMAPGTATSITDTGLARRTTYTYRVQARNVYGESPYSNTATARTKH